ncbi:DUF2333 family protein [Taklimakanibacter deserti]|uniref:DUF2333 family protein n=1 Tax=Taklimakanibacter deserti TaxID=2267839 RepID=UPI0034D73FC4
MVIPSLKDGTRVGSAVAGKGIMMNPLAIAEGLLDGARRWFRPAGGQTMAIGAPVRRKGFLAAGLLAVAVLGLVALYAHFFWSTQRWTDFNPDYQLSSGAPASGGGGGVTQGGTIKEKEVCRRSAIVDVTADLIDFNVNQNDWASSMVLYKIGLFGLDWDATPFFDNKAAFQRGVNQALRRTTVELVDTLARVRGTSQADPNLQDARGNLQFDEYTWYFGVHPFGPKTPTPSFYRSAMRDLRAFNDRLERCLAVFDPRADNLIQFIDRIANDIGGTSAVLRERAERYNSGWFDTRADDRFWFAYGQLYAYYGILRAAHLDFQDVIAQRRLSELWRTAERQMRGALDLQPFIVSNGAESGWLMPSHLTALGFYILRARSNLVEIRLVLDR